MFIQLSVYSVINLHCIVYCSAQSELVPYAEVINSMLVQVLNWSQHAGDKAPEQQKPLRYSTAYCQTYD